MTLSIFPVYWVNDSVHSHPGELLSQLEYQARWRGGTLLKVATDFPSTQLCHECGHRNGKLGLEDQRWGCPGCGMAHDRDVNAARNIRDYGPQATRSLPVDAGVRPAPAGDRGGIRNEANLRHRHWSVDQCSLCRLG